MTKINFIFDKTKKSLIFKKKILKKIKNSSPKKSDCIVVAGGDGFMLQSVKKNYKYKKPFYGINCGTYGFLMNKLNYKNLKSKIKRAKKININPIKIKYIDNKDRRERIGKL